MALVGGGPISLLMTKLLARMGVKRLFVSEPNDTRLTFASSWGADAVHTPLQSSSFVSLIKEGTEGLGVSHVFELSGSSSGMAQCSSLAMGGGAIIMVGIPDDDRISFSHSEARKKGLEMKMVRGVGRMMSAAIDVLAKDASFGEILQKVSPDKVEDTFSQLESPDHSLLKPIITF